MKFDPEYTQAWYDQLAEGEWERWDKTPATRLHFAIFLHHLRAAVQAGDHVLDAGCGAGRFSKELIAMGAHVTAFDLSPTQLDLCRQGAPGAVRYDEGSITDLSRYDDASFDVTLCIGGAISYTFDEAATAMAELARVTRPGGRVVLSAMCLLGSVHFALKGILTLDPEANREVFSTGHLPRDLGNDHECHLFRVNELRDLMAGAGFEQLELSAAGFLTTAHEDLDLPEEGTPQYEFLLDAELAACAENPGGGPHIIATGVAGGRTSRSSSASI